MGIKLDNSGLPDSVFLIYEKVKGKKGHQKDRIEYEGYAFPGTSLDQSGWIIVKYTYDQHGDVIRKRIADGDVGKFDKIFSKAESYKYM